MSVQVEIEGKSPNSVIEVGERRVVTRTAYINTLVRNGFITVVGLVAPPPPIVAPTASASKAEWREFLTARNIAHTASDTKAELIARWETPTE